MDTFGDLKHLLRDALDDTLEPYLWSDEELYNYLARACSIFISTVYANVVPYQKKVNQNTYSIDLSDCPMDLSAILSVMFNSSVLTRDDERTYGQSIPSSPLYYTIDYPQKSILIDPIPLSDGELFVNFSAKLDDERISHFTKVPLNPEHIFYLVKGAQAFAYLKRDSEAFNEKEYDKNMRMFQYNMELAKRDIMRVQQLVPDKLFPDGFF